MSLYKNKYRIESIRLKGYDYSRNGAYFITICTKKHTEYFGSIEDKKLVLSNVGVIADILLNEIKNHAKNIIIDEYIIMPNHIHMILIIDNVDRLLQTRSPVPTKSEHKSWYSQISPKKGTVSTIIRSYKSAVTKHAHRLDFEFFWQTRFYDYLIRNQKDYHRIKKYIINNPENWENDCFMAK